MSQPNRGYSHDQYATYQNYHQAPHTYSQHPMVVIPPQPRHSASHAQTSSLPPQPGVGPNYYQQFPSQYQTAPQHQYRPSQSQGRPQSSALYYSQSPAQHPYQVQQPYASYQQQVRQPPVQAPPQAPYQHTPKHSTQLSAPVAQPLSSPDPLSSDPTPYVRPQPRAPPPTKQSHGPKPEHRRRSQPSGTQHSLALQQLPQQRVVARVEIPVHRPVLKPTQPEMARSPKRRRSNEGHAVPVCEAPVPQKRNSSLQAKQALVSSSPLTELASSQLPPTPEPSVDYQSVLLALADEYISAAYSMSVPIANGSVDDLRLDEYHRLISNGMGCLESVLSNYRQSDPRREARIRLRLASLMVEETENDEEAEEILGKGISLCERSRLPDLKYAMHHLSARLMFKKTPKGALKAVDKLLQEVEAFQLTHWVYTFRFLRVSLSLQSGGHSDTATVVKHLTAVATMAEERRHIAVQIVAAVLEAIVHLRSSSADSLDLAQRAMATARTHQLGKEMQRMPQMQALLDCVDLMCSLLSYKPIQVLAKKEQMQEKVDGGHAGLGWSKDGTFALELTSTPNEHLEQDTGGIMTRSTTGQALLGMRWMARSQLYALEYLLSAISKLSTEVHDMTVNNTLTDALKLVQLAPDAVPQSFSTSTASEERRGQLGVAMRLFTIIASCGRYEWAAARTAIQDMKEAFESLNLELDHDTARTLLYLEASCSQGLGELQTALVLYQSPTLAFEVNSKASKAEKDLRALATLHSIFIIRTLVVKDSVEIEEKLSAVGPYCLGHNNQAMASVYQLAKATAKGPNVTIIKTKQFLQSAVKASQAAQNRQLTCIIINIMTSLFFTGIVGSQAEKSAAAGRTLAKQARSSLWTAVADDMYSGIMEGCGKTAEAATARQEAQIHVSGLPESLKKML